MNFKSIIMLCIGIIAATAIASIDKIQPLINDRNIIQLENGNVRLGKVYEERLNTDYTVTDSNGKEVFSITSPTPNIYDAVYQKIKEDVDGINANGGVDSGDGKKEKLTMSAVEWTTDVKIKRSTYVTYKSETQNMFVLTLDTFDTTIPKGSSVLAVIEPLKKHSQQMMQRFERENSFLSK